MAAAVNSRHWRRRQGAQHTHTREIRSETISAEMITFLEQLREWTVASEARLGALEAENRTLRMTVDQLIAGYREIESDLAAHTHETQQIKVA